MQLGYLTLFLLGVLLSSAILLCGLGVSMAAVHWVFREVGIVDWIVTAQGLRSNVSASLSDNTSALLRSTRYATDVSR